MRRWTAVPLIALAALAASAASAKDPTLPTGTWDLQTTSATYAGPSASIRSALTKLIQRRVEFSPACTQTVCSTDATVKNARGRQVRFVMTSTGGRPYAGRVVMRIGLRCAGRHLRATLTMTATIVRRQQEPGDRLTGTTAARAVNPGNCALFAGKARALRTTRFVGVAVSG